VVFDTGIHNRLPSTAKRKRPFPRGNGRYHRGPMTVIGQ
jgi:hypothetical protein